MATAAKSVRSDEQGRDPVAQSFHACLARSRHVTAPFDHWLLDNVLPAADVEGIISLPIAPPESVVFSGKRETNNSTRVYFTRENQAKYPVCCRIVEGFDDPQTRKLIESTTGADLSDAHLRIEYCQDSPGFWLEPHTDIPIKKFTMLVYLSDDPGLALAGTDIHEGPPGFKYVGSAPYGKNRGAIFIPGTNTWHAVGHHPVQGLRRSIIINFVTSGWRDKWELATF